MPVHPNRLHTRTPGPHHVQRGVVTHVQHVVGGHTRQPRGHLKIRGSGLATPASLAVTPATKWVATPVLCRSALPLVKATRGKCLARVVRPGSASANNVTWWRASRNTP